jgi:probable phosphoglycerate mutase
MTILLVRHGETAGNASRIVQMPEIPLSERGLEQAARLGARLAGDGVAGILASDYTRAEMTARAIQDATGAPLEIDALLRERHFGVHRGTPYAELSVDLFGPDYEPPGGESWDALHARVDRAWARVVALAGRTPGHLVVVTHGLVCHSIVRRHARFAGEVPLRFDNSSLTEIDGAPPHHVSRLNCTAHLQGAKAAAAAPDPRAGRA